MFSKETQRKIAKTLLQKRKEEKESYKGTGNFPKISVYIKSLQWTTEHICAIYPYSKTIEVWLTGPDEGDPSEYDFDEVIITFL